jgi:hypothetical protein
MTYVVLPTPPARSILWMLLCVFTFSLAGTARGQTAGDSHAGGSFTGTVREVAREFLLIKGDDPLPRRYWFKGAELKPAQRPPLDPALASLLPTLKPNDTVDVRWSFDDRPRLDALARATPKPTPVPMAPPAAAPAPGPAQATSPPSAEIPASERLFAPSNQATTLGERVNAFIDDLQATGQRLLDLPAVMLLVAGLGVGVALALVLGRFASKDRRPRLVRTAFVAIVTFLLLCLAWAADRKVVQLEREVHELRTRLAAVALASPAAESAAAPVAPAGQVTARVAPSSARTTAAAAAPVATAPRQTLLFDLEAAKKALAGQFDDVTLQPTIVDDATDVVAIRAANPLVQAYLAIVDLKNPAVGITLGTRLDAKTLTSQFARENDCTVAINGEAGMSPGLFSGLGVWRGYLVDKGNVLQKEDPKIPRPFLMFDPKNAATFTAAAAADRALPATAYNVIWGRLDAVVNGVVQTADERNRQPRTAMGLSADGRFLYLLVVDGRQQRYSIGFTRAEVGSCLKAFGTHNGMLCDEGGSSCMYLKQRGGILNVPSDNQGQERPTYTHFGITFRRG